VGKPNNENLLRVLRLTREMMLLADQGDEARQDDGCGVLYGTLRDSAYKIRKLAEQERDQHVNDGCWDCEEQKAN
jgi:hypothetical protein